MSWRDEERRNVEAHEQAVKDARRPLTDEERRWISRLKRTIADKPHSLWLLAAEMNALAVYIDTNGEAICRVATASKERIGQLR